MTNGGGNHGTVEKTDKQAKGSKEPVKTEDASNRKESSKPEPDKKSD